MARLNKYQLHAAIIRLLFKYNFIPKDYQDEEAFMKELQELLEL